MLALHRRFVARSVLVTVLAACAASAPDGAQETPLSPRTIDDAPSLDASGVLHAAASGSAAVAAPAGPSEPPWMIDKRGDRIGSKSFRTWIWDQPMRSRKHVAIGAMRVGTSVGLKSKTPVQGQGCNGKWYAIEPHGFICTDETTTFDFDSPYWRALATLRPKPGIYPYRYAFSMGAPMYSRIPTPAEQKSAEYDMGKTKRFQTLGKWSEGHEKLVTTKDEDFFKADGPTPDFYDGTKGIAGSPWNPVQPKVKVIPAGSGFSYSRVFEAEGRLWLLTPDLFLIPADRVWPYQTSDFKGVELDEKNTLPVAWVRSASGTAKFTKDGDNFTKTSDKHAGRKPVFLTGKSEKVKKVEYWEAKDGSWVADEKAVNDEISIVLPPKELRYQIKADEKWLQSSILGGTMTAFVGLKPVYTTLWSPGLGGVPVKGNDPKKFATTEVGIFPIQWKDAVEIMSPDPGAPTVFWFADVPWIQYVHPPMAMHVSYWHDNFGYPMSAECLNTSAADGMWLFNFTLPKIPEAWGSVGAGKSNGPSTKINIIP